SELSRLVLRHAVRECVNWPEHMSVSVNLSASDFRNVCVEDMISETLKEFGLAPERLIVEITETALMEDQSRVGSALTAVRKLGVGVALDDFGTGYSSLAYLKTMSFTKLKIDRTFVS